ncbi:hypothetical protein AVEN_38436-1 [Araneus ventricosus]|uniref:Uncharacterized protein n=1 Tax=Araneus ventricosus TaxID=182803 RepID=A0A4Y2NKB8_ARAVE|nr:hypothetical protein AVEN_38436-1 [Araneus ventricosus]
MLLRPRWPSGKLSASEPKGSRLETDLIEDPSFIGRVAGYIIRKGPNDLQLLWCGSLEKRVTDQAQSSSPQLAPITSNYEVRPKIALVLLQNGALI